MAEKKSFVLYNDCRRHIEKLSDNDAGQLFKAIFAFADGEEPQNLSDVADMCFSFISDQMLRDREKYKERCEKNAEIARRRWSKSNANECERIPTDTKNADTDNDNDTVNDTENVNDTETVTDINTAAPPSSSPQQQYLFLCDDFGTANADAYIKKVKKWYAEKGKSVSNLYETARNWLEKDGVKKPDFDAHKYDFVINNF